AGAVVAAGLARVRIGEPGHDTAKRRAFDGMYRRRLRRWARVRRERHRPHGRGGEAAQREAAVEERAGSTGQRPGVVVDRTEVEAVKADRIAREAEVEH